MPDNHQRCKLNESPVILAEDLCMVCAEAAIPKKASTPTLRLGKAWKIVELSLASRDKASADVFLSRADTILQGVIDSAKQLQTRTGAIALKGRYQRLQSACKAVCHQMIAKATPTKHLGAC